MNEIIFNPLSNFTLLTRRGSLNLILVPISFLPLFSRLLTVEREQSDVVEVANSTSARLNFSSLLFVPCNPLQFPPK